MSQLEGLEAPLARGDVEDRDGAGRRDQFGDGRVVGVGGLAIERLLDAVVEAVEEEGRGDVGGDA